MVRQESFSNHGSLINSILRLLDVVMIFLGFVVPYYLYFGSLELEGPYLSALLMAGIVQTLIFSAFGCYRSWRGRSAVSQIRVVLLAWFCVWLILLLVSVGLKNTIFFSRFWFFSWLLSGAVFLVVYRRMLASLLGYLRKQGWNQKRVAIYGAGNLGKMVAERIQGEEWTGYDVRYFLDDDANLTGRRVLNVPVILGNSLKLEQFIVANDVQEVWITLPLRAEKRVAEILSDLRNLSVAIRFIPNFFGFQFFLNHGITEIAGITGVELNHSPMADGLNRLIKAIEDRVLAGLFLLMASPLMVLIAIAIRLESRGPVIFKQLRNGWDGIPIRVYKFRTMFLHSEENGDVTQAKRNDARVTRVGQFLRRTSLDELPQFFNVLQGRMSIVGPRPHAVVHNKHYTNQIDCYAQRHRVKPGITGWAQVNGWRGETDTLDKMQKRVDHDLYYIRNWSVWFDLKIILMTIFRGIFDERAY